MKNHKKINWNRIFWPVCLISFGILIVYHEVKTIKKSHEMWHYELTDGSRADCSRIQYGNAGINLMGCVDGKEYLAQTNVIRSHVIFVEEMKYP